MRFMPEYSIGLDLGGTNLRAAAIDRAGHILDRRATATNPAAGREAMLGYMVNAIAELRDSCGADGLAGIGIGVPGFILLKEGIIRNSNNLACLEDFPIRDEIERRLGAHVILENDANAAALGEKWIGRRAATSTTCPADARHRHRRRNHFRRQYCTAIWAWPANWGTSRW